MPVIKTDRDLLLRSALKVFKSNGYHNTSMADIAKECGLLKGSIYHYFESKESLMLSVLRMLREKYQIEVFTPVIDSDATPIEKLEHLANASEEIFLAETHGCFFTSIGLETVHVVDAFTSEIRMFFEDWIACLQNIFSDIIPPSEARLHAEQTVAEIEGALLLVQIYQDPEILRRTHRFLLERYTRFSEIYDEQ